MGNCQDVRHGGEGGDGYDYGEDKVAYAPEKKSKIHHEDRVGSNDTTMRLPVTSAADDEALFSSPADDTQVRLFEIPRRMLRKRAPAFESNMYFDGVKKVKLDDYKGKFLVLFFYPYDFNKIFQQEILDFSEQAGRFQKYNCELLGCSIDSHLSHMNYVAKSRAEGGLGDINFPLMVDVNKKIASDYGVFVNNGTDQGTCLRSTFIIDSKQIVRHLAINDIAGHLKAEEILRLVKAIQDGDKLNAQKPTTPKSSSNSIPAPSASQQPKSLYEKIGGEAAVSAAVDIFYKKMLADSKVAHYFKSTDMTKQMSLQSSFLCFALGGPKKYVGKSMRDAHQYMRLTNVEFDVTVTHLVNTLKELNVDAETIGEIGKLLEPLRKEIVFTQALSIYEQIGGEKAVESAVDIFYSKMMEDKTLSLFFKGVEMPKQKQMMRLFLTMALGGSKNYQGKDMKEAHKHLGLTDSHFDATVGHLLATLKQLNVDEKIAKQIEGQIEQLRKDIVSPKPVIPPLTTATTGATIQSQGVIVGSGASSPNSQATKNQKEASSKSIGGVSTPTIVTTVKKPTLIERIGGESKVDVLVGTLLGRVYADKRVNGFFVAVEQAKLRVTLAQFIVQFTGGQKVYKGKNLREAHAGMKVNDVQFNVFMTHLRESLASMKVEPSVYHEFCNLFESFRAHIVTVKLSIFDRLGGEPALAVISDKLYQKVIADTRIKHFFERTDMTRLKEMQKLFLMFATGGPKKYSGKSMKDAHANIKINDIHFSAYKENLLLTLKEQLVDPQTYQEIAQLLETQRQTIVSVTLPLIDRLGGDTGILAIVNRFYDRVQVDPRVKKFFVNVDMSRLRSMNHKFLLYCVKGEPYYTGKNMKDAHAALSLNDTHFNLIKDHLIQSMRDCSKDPLSLNDVGSLVEGLRKDIVSVKLPLVERLGGEQAMKKAVEKLYQKLQADPRTREMFKNVDITAQKATQVNFLTMIMGGANDYKGKNMKDAHAGLKINDPLFTVFKDCVLQSFREIGIDNITLGEVDKLVEQFRKMVVSVRPSIFERLGGEKIMQAIIDRFYEKLIANANIGSFFVSIDQEKQKNMLRAFFTGVLGGQPVYKGKNLAKAHAHFKVTEAMFTEFKACMEASLKENKVHPLVAKDVLTVVEHFKNEVVRS